MVLNLFFIGDTHLENAKWATFTEHLNYKQIPNCKMYQKLKFKVWNNLSTHKCVTTPWLRTTALIYQNLKKNKFSPFRSQLNNFRFPPLSNSSKQQKNQLKFLHQSLILIQFFFCLSKIGIISILTDSLGRGEKA